MKAKIIDISTTKGIKKAEKLQLKGYDLYPDGYIISSAGIDKVKFETPKNK